MVLVCVCKMHTSLYLPARTESGVGKHRVSNISCTDSFMHVRSWCLIWTLSNCFVPYLCMLSFYSFVAYVSECIFLCPLVKHMCAPYGSGVAPTRTKVLAAARRLCQRHVQPPSLHFRWIDLCQDEGAGARLGLWQCRASEWYMAKAVAPLKKLLFGAA